MKIMDRVIWTGVETLSDQYCTGCDAIIIPIFFVDSFSTMY